MLKSTGRVGHSYNFNNLRGSGEGGIKEKEEGRICLPLTFFP